MPCISTEIIYISGYHSDSTISCAGSASEGKRAQNQDFRTPRSLKAGTVFSPSVTWWNSSPLAQVQIFPSLSHTGSSSEKHEDDFKIKESRLCLNSPPRGWMWHLGCHVLKRYYGSPFPWYEASKDKVSLSVGWPWKCTLPVFPSPNDLLLSKLKHLKP